MARRVKTREDDEMELFMLRRRCEGVPVSVIARRFGMRRAAVQTRTDRIRKADETYDPAGAKGAYWT